MPSAHLLRTTSLLGLALSFAFAACGSSDDKKTRRTPPPGDAGQSSGGGSSAPQGGDGNDAGTSNPPTGDAGSDPVGGSSSTEGGSSGTEGGTTGDAGAAGAPPEPNCPSGTANCDDNPDDCETNVTEDENNCGRCDRVCGGVAECHSGWCDPTAVLAPAVANWCGGAFTATKAYMITCWGGFSEVRTTTLELGQSLLGTPIVTYNSLPVTHMRGILIDGSNVLFGLQENPGHLYKFNVNADGPEDVTVAYTFEDGTRFDDLLLVGDSFYWNHNTHTGGQVAPSTIKTRTKAGTSSTILVSGLGLSYDLQVFEEQMVWLERRTDDPSVGLYRAPRTGAPIEDVELLAEASSGAFLVRQGDYAYFTVKVAAPNGKIRRIKVDEANAEPEDVAIELQLPEGLVTDEAYAYFKQGDALYRVALGGGTPEQLSPVVPANDVQTTQIFHVDDKYVYFGAGPNGGSSTLVRVAK